MKPFRICRPQNRRIRPPRRVERHSAPVSYTHLDVYKRQHRELIKGEGSWNDRACGPIEHLHLAGSFDIRGERQAYARSVGLHTYGCLEELLSDEKVDIVLCATPNDVHKEIVLRALEAGCLLYTSRCV